jgi:2'-5' RNA ligase
LGPGQGIRDRWRAGRSRYCAWIIRVDSLELTRRVQEVAKVLRGWISPVPAQQFHITLFVAGFPCVLPRADDDVPRRLLMVQARALAELVQQADAIELEVGEVNSFGTAAFLEVRDCRGVLGRQRRALAETLVASGPPEVRFSPYKPHDTQGK